MNITLIAAALFACLVGAALLGQEKYSAAEPLLVQGYEGLKQRSAQIPANYKRLLTDALDRLIQLYEAWEKPDQVARWREEARAGQ